MWRLAASPTVTSSLLLRRFNKSVMISSTKSCRATLLLLIHQTSFFTTTTTTFNSSSSSSKFGGGGTFILHQQQQANNLHTTTTTTTTTSSSKFGTIILQTNEPADDLGYYYRGEKDDIKMFMLSSSGSGEEEEEEEEDKDDNLHTTTTTTTFNSSSSSSSSSKFGTIILQTNEPSVDLDSYGKKKPDIIKMFMLSSGSGEEEEDKDDDDDDDQKKKKKKEKMVVFNLDEDLGFSALYKDFQLQDSLRMVGSCNGIICLHDPMDRSPQRGVYLWNPATKQFKILPESIYRSKLQGARSKPQGAFKDFVGFGFDVKTRDYKVLLITPFVPPESSSSSSSYNNRGGDGEGCMCRVQVYSLSTDSWRLLDGIDSLPLSPTQDQFGNRQGTYLDGSCFFLGTKPINHYGIRDLMLLSFDFTKEIFTIMELPDKERTMNKLVLKYESGQEFDDVLKLDSKYWSKPEFVDVFRTPGYCDISDDLSYLGDKLAAFITPRIDCVGGYVFTTPQLDLKGGGYWYYDMWGWLSDQNESGSSRVVVYKPKSWIKLREVRIETKSEHPGYSEPRCVSNDREFALISTCSIDNERKKLMLFNLVTGKAIEDFTIGDHRDCRAAYVYKESQVSIMGGGNALLLRWQLPTHGTTYKLNLDAHSTGRYDGDFGIGLCLTSDTGGCIGVRSLQKRYVSELEALAILEAIKWAKELELSPIIIESDSKNCVSFFMDDDDDNSTYWSSEALSLLREAKLLLKSSENSSISFQYCSRSCNYVADIAAKLGSDNVTWSCKDWTANFPGEVVMSLSKDLGIEIQYGGWS